ncbi:PKD domain-containing protein [Undibacterium sp. Di27W]|uniref:PKD domain-containing protein n=1 Tax=Undibacterium sp. Di27W TaxID=3413036 RepID=UPI003BF185A4
MVQQIKTALVIFSSLVLVACGGGSSSSGSSGSSGSTNNGSGATPMTIGVPDALTVVTGAPLNFTGQVSSSAGVITNMYWQVENLTLSANALASVSNADCKIIQKSTAGTDATCVLQVAPPVLLTADYTYKLTLNAVDVKGNTIKASTTLLVKQEASTTANPVAKAGSALTATTGDKVTLTCAGSGGTPATTGEPYSYQWVISDAVGTTINLATTDTATTTFVAPIVAVASTLKFQCRVTDDKQKVGTATQNVTVTPIIKPTVVPISYSGGVVSAGATITLDGSKSVKYDANGKADTSTPIFYFWKQKSGPVVEVFNSFSSVASTALPKFIDTRTAFVFTLNVSNSAITPGGFSLDPITQMDVVFYVDPLPPISLISYTPTQIVASGGVATLKVDAPSNTGSNIIYYRWSQVAGPTVFIAGATTGNAGFVAPTVSSDTLMVFRASGSYQPITVANPAAASIDVIVLVQAPPKQ